MRKGLFLLLLFAIPIPAHAQAVQSKPCPRGDLSAGPTGHMVPCKFDKQVQPRALLTIGEIGYSVPRDTQGNIWQLAFLLPYDGMSLWYALDAKGGDDTVSVDQTITWSGVIAEYPPSLGLDTATYGTYQGQNLSGDPQGGDSDMGWTMPMKTSSFGEVVVSFGFTNTSLDPDLPCVATPGPWSTLRQCFYGAIIFEDYVAPVPGWYISSVLFGRYGHWLMGSAAFRMRP